MSLTNQTTTAAAPATTPTGEPPVYDRGEAPEHLRTASQLKAQRLKPAKDQQPAGLLRMYQRGRGWVRVPLYDPAGATPMRALSPKQREAMTARRTCPECREVRDHVVHVRCAECRTKRDQEAQERRARTCNYCRREGGAALPKDAYGWPACDLCRVFHAARRQAEEERTAAWRRTCPGRDCGKATATDEEIAEARAAGTWRGPRWCPPCEAREQEDRAQRQREHEEQQRQAAEDRRRQVAELASWAHEALTDPAAVILDTETTGLHDEARIVEIAVVAVDGTVLLDTLINPGEPITADSAYIHGITDQDVADAPTFTSILEQLSHTLDGRRVLIWNAPYDTGRLRHELTEHYQRAGHPNADELASTWMAGMRFEDAMIPFSDWYGEWSDYWQGYAWQPLYGGGHRALSDCRAVIDRLREMTFQDDEATEPAPAAGTR